MASHNHNSSHINRSNVVSLNKTYSVSRRRNHKGKSAQTTSLVTETTSALRDESDIINNATKALALQQPNQNFSLRNSLRTAQSNATPRPQVFPFTMPVMNNFYQYDNFPLTRGVEDNINYEKLHGECFYRNIGGNQICMLCRKKHNSRDVQLEFHNQLFNDLQDALFDQTPSLDSIHMHAVQELLLKWYDKNVLTDNFIKYRLDIVKEFNGVLSAINPECSTRLTGSLISGTSLVTSNINLELIHPNSKLFETDVRAKNSIHHKLIDPDADLGNQINNHIIHYDLISNPMETLFKLWTSISEKDEKTSNSLFKAISKVNDLYANVPKLVLMHRESGIELEICCNVQSSHKLAILISTYLSLDSRACMLSILVKVWAKICKIDNPDTGTLPPYVYVILVIYFLQRTSPPILPCLHDILYKGTRQTDSTKTREDQARDTMQNGSQLSSKDTSTKNTINGQECSDLLQESCPEEVDEVDDEEEEDDLYIDEKNESIKNLSWCSSNTSPVHELFIEFLKFMMYELEFTQKSISIRSLRRGANKRWNAQVKVIENPIKPSVNFSRCIGSYQIYQFILQCFRRSFYYLTAIPVEHNLKQIEKRKGEPTDYIKLYFNSMKLDSFLAKKENSFHNSAERKSNIVQDMIRQNDLFARDVEVVNALFDSLPPVPSSEQLLLLTNFLSKQYKETLLRPKDLEVAIFCWLCKSSGHTKSECPKGKIEKLQLDYILCTTELDFVVNLDNQFIINYQNCKITHENSFIHNKIVEELTRMINSSTGLNCRLELYGSTVNNLGCYNSDLDICMTLEGNPTGRGVDCVDILNRIYHKVLKVKTNILDVEPILSARVPIIKFKYLRQHIREREYDIDLSMYNQCATYNSKLLKMYTLIDDRLPQLFYLVKRYAKACQIADASRGSLSSYAWSIMVIHYLQHTNPPILPVLQEARRDINKPVIGINGWNVWFNDDLRSVKQEPKNLCSLTQLFKGFFIYYGTFDFDMNIVSIRKSSIISRFQKNWNNCLMAIEDPFELTYNLASRLDDPMAIYIMNSFAQNYKHIVEVQNSICHLGKTTHVLRDLFDGYAITHTTKPPFRGCRICHRIGHRVKDCPEARHNNFRRRNRQNGNNNS